MLTVKQVSELTGISVRALHHYDAIGLLKPTKTTEAGYRLYDDGAIRRLQSILLFRELQFPLREIKEILDSPEYDPSKAIAQQIELLELQYKHIGELISHAREIQSKGMNIMSFKAFDKSEIENYKAEAKQRWGKTDAYRECEQKMSGQSAEQQNALSSGLMRIFAQLGELRHLQPEDKAVQDKINDLQSYITDNYYRCTDEILLGLGEMYVGDERFRNNIDSVGGEGTAQLARNAIRVHCGR